MNSKLIFLALASLSLILLLRLAFFFANFKPYPEGQMISFETRVSSQPKVSSRGQQVTLNLPNSQRVSVRLALIPEVGYGDQLKIEGRVKYFEAENGNKIASISYPEFELVEVGSDTNLILKVREDIISLFNSSLNPEFSSLVLGITFGIKQEMPKDFHDKLEKTGLLHVIAASGMNITMVGGFLMTLFAIFLKRQLALILAIAGIVFYAFMAGFEPSIIRASIMGILVFSAQLTGRQSSSFLGLFIAAFLMLFKNPSLIYDIGFQLSFMATLGLIYLRPLFFIKQKIKKSLEKSFIGEDLATTISAQIFTLPILLINFGSYSIVSILVNALVLWTVPIIMVIGGISAIAGLIFDPLGYILSYLSIPFLIFFEKTVELFSRFGGGVNLVELPSLLVAGYYLILASIVIYVRRRE